VQRARMCKQDRLPVLTCCSVKSVHGEFAATCAGSCALTAPLLEEQASCCMCSLSSCEGEQVSRDASGLASTGESAADVVSAVVKLERSACCTMACTLGSCFKAIKLITSSTVISLHSRKSATEHPDATKPWRKMSQRLQLQLRL